MMRGYIANEKKYVKVLSMVLVSSFLLPAIFLPIVFFILNGEINWDENKYFYIKLVYSVGLIMSAFLFVQVLFDFFVIIDSKGVKADLFKRRVLWEEIVTVKLVGLHCCSFLNTMLLVGSFETVKIKLYIYQDQTALLSEIEKYLPWTNNLDVIELPSEAFR